MAPASNRAANLVFFALSQFHKKTPASPGRGSPFLQKGGLLGQQASSCSAFRNSRYSSPSQERPNSGHTGPWGLRPAPSGTGRTPPVSSAQSPLCQFCFRTPSPLRNHMRHWSSRVTISQSSVFSGRWVMMRPSWLFTVWAVSLETCTFVLIWMQGMIKTSFFQGLFPQGPGTFLTNIV